MSPTFMWMYIIAMFWFKFSTIKCNLPAIPGGMAGGLEQLHSAMKDPNTKAMVMDMIRQHNPQLKDMSPEELENMIQFASIMADCKVDQYLQMGSGGATNGARPGSKADCCEKLVMPIGICAQF